MRQNSFVALSARRLYDIGLTYESDTLCRWLDPISHLVNFTLCKRKQSWWFTEENDLQLKPQKLVANQLYPMVYRGEQCLLFVSIQDVKQGLAQYVALPKQDVVSIGRNSGDICYDNPLVSAHHAQLRCLDGEWWIDDLHSANGVYVNHRRIRSVKLQLGDCIYIMGCRILFGVSFLAVYGEGSIALKARLPPYHPSEDCRVVVSHPQCIVRSYPVVDNSEPVTFSLKDPPALAQRERQPILYMLGPSLTMSIASVSSSLFMLQSVMANGQPITTAAPSLIMAGSMMLSTLAWPLWQRRYEKRRERDLICQRNHCYERYLSKQQRTLEALLEKQKMRLNDCYVAISDSCEVWRYELAQGEMHLCIGIGDQPVTMPFSGNDHPLQIHEDDMEQKRQEFLHQRCVLKGVPLILTMHRQRCFSVVGSKALQLAYARYVLAHHVMLYDPHSVLVVIACKEEDGNLFPRFLPHQFNEAGYRLLCHDIRSMAALAIQIRQAERPILAISLSAEFTTFLMQNASDLPLALLACHEPLPFTERIFLKEGKGQLSHQDFKWHYEEMFDMVIHELCNLQTERMHRTFPKQLSFLEMYHVNTIPQLQVEKRWQQRDSENSLQAQIGVTADGGVMTLDLHERSHGPHGIVAGMTGSGKSELLITLLLSLAINYSPCDCAFVLIDYKGGGMAKALERLPHTAGIITNLHGSLIQRSLNSMDVELLRRQRLFAQVMEQIGAASMNIDVYQKLYHEHQVSEVIPHLVIVADEFAELKQQEPQFMEQLIRIARIGRSLGIHLILATQKPSGIVDDQIWSNSRFHICLKVADQTDSMDMLKRKEGAQIKTVGRFYLQVGYDELFIEGQSAYAKMPYDPQCSGLGRAFIKEMNAEGRILREWKREVKQAVCSECNALIDELCQLAHKHDLFPPPLWLNPLPETLHYQAVGKDCFALADDPAHCRQFPVAVNANQCNTICFAQRIHDAAQAISSYLSALLRSEADDLPQIILIDGTQDLQIWERSPAIYGRCTLDQSEDITFLMSMLKQEKQCRSSKRWLLVIHHVAAFLEAFENADTWLLDLAFDHGGSGIHVLLSATSMADIRTRLLQQFENYFVFHMQDEQEVHSIIGRTWRFHDNALRAIWKKHEDVYEVQFVQENGIDTQLHNKRDVSHMPILEEYPAYSQLQAEATSSGIVIGRSLSDRKVLTLPLEGNWLISGTQYRPFFTLLKQIAANEQWPIIFGDDLDVLTCETMAILALSPTELMRNLHHPFVNECMQDQNVIWCGLGLEEYRYLWNLPPTISVKSRQDALWCREEVVLFRRIITL